MLPPKDVVDATVRRFEARSEKQAETKAKIAEGKILEADDPKRLVLRTERLLANPNVRPKLLPDEARGAISRKSLERVLKANNLVDVWFFDAGEKASGTVGRVHVNSDEGSGFGTGFLVSPNLILTNNHVLPDKETARKSMIEFGYERRPDGVTKSSHTFALDPEALFITDPTEEGLDFTLVAVNTTSKTDGVTPLSTYPYNPITDAQGKIALGECINIIQHPDGDPKKLALQDNDLTDLFENFLQYETDTMPGSSGSPLFNNQWEIVGLHHSGVPEIEDGKLMSIDGVPWEESMGEDRIHWKANEGIRISKIIGFARESRGSQSARGQALLDQMLQPSLLPSSTPLEPVAAKEIDKAPPAKQAPAASGEVNLTIPLHVSIRLGEPATGNNFSVRQGPAVEEAIRLKAPFIERPYDNRAGYDPNHLGIEVPFPKVIDESLVSKLTNGSHEIPYEHFSVVLNRARRMAMFTASNLNAEPNLRRPEPGHDYTRNGLTGLADNEAEQWVADPRVPAQDQIPDIFYTKDSGAFDKGHIARREDMCWGESFNQIRRANGDTFHVTNCSPQVKGFNQSQQGTDNWGDLEDEISRQLGASKLSLFAGPVFTKDDRRFRGRDDIGEVSIQVPSRYWKVVLASEGGALQAFGFVLKQDLSAVGLEFRPTDEWRKFMVPLAELQKLMVGFEFPKAVLDADQFEKLGPELAKALGATVGAPTNAVVDTEPKEEPVA